MNRSQFAKDLQSRLASLLEAPVFAKARQDRSAQSKGPVADALIAHNMAVSDEMLRLDESSVNGEVKDNM